MEKAGGIAKLRVSDMENGSLNVIILMKHDGEKKERI